ncbi:adenylyl-sulfate kinase [Spirosoma flavus]
MATSYCFVEERLSKPTITELTYLEADRQENLRRMGYLAKMFTRQCVLVLIASINLYQHIRAELAKYNGPPKRFLSPAAFRH